MGGDEKQQISVVHGAHPMGNPAETLLHSRPAKKPAAPIFQSRSAKKIHFRPASSYSLKKEKARCFYKA